MLSLEKFAEPAAQSCPDCGGKRTFLSGGLIQDQKAVGLYSMHLYRHGGEREAFLTVSFGDHGVDSDSGPADTVTFGARFGQTVGTEGPAFSAVNAKELSPPTELYGRRVDRDEALAHPWIGRFWDACDVLADELLLNRRNWPDGIGAAGVLRRAGSRARHLLHRRV